MLAELRPKAQITIPKNIVISMKLNTGDKFEIFEKDGMICICPVVVYPKSYVDSLQAEVDSIKSDINVGRTPVFENIDSMFAALDKEA